MQYMQKGGIHSNPGCKNCLKKLTLTGTVTLKDISGNNLPDQIPTTSKPKGREEKEQEYAKIRQ